jgi:hypothetical protein
MSAGTMSATSNLETGTLLLLLNDREFLRVGALVGLRARTSNRQEVALVDQFIDSDIPRQEGRRIFVSAIPNLRSN